MSRIYKNCKEMLSEELRNVSELGTNVHPQSMQNLDVSNDPDFMTKEIIGNTFTITDTSDAEEMYKVMLEKYKIDCNLNWAKAEFLERVSDNDINPGEAYKIRPEIWNQFLVEGKFHYTYNNRIKKVKNSVINELKLRPDSRRAVMMIFDPYQDIPDSKNRISCSLCYQFLIRNIDGKRKLHIIYMIRSNDILTHFVNDIYLAVQMQRYIANILKIEVGYFTYFCSSFHAYHKDLKKYNFIF